MCAEKLNHEEHENREGHQDLNSGFVTFVALRDLRG
jgi:hypothetical protein